MEIICEVCGGKAKRPPREVFRSKHHYCTHKCATDGSKNTRKGMKFSDKHRQHLSDSHKAPRPYRKGFKHSEETKEKIRKSKTGIPVHTEKHKRELSESMKGEKHFLFGKHRSEETKEKLRIAKSGSNSSLWRGGITNKNRKRFANYKWRDLAQKIRIRDRFVCQQCGKYPSLDVHHKTPYRLTHDDNKNNLVTLCRSCHMQTEGAFC